MQRLQRRFSRRAQSADRRLDQIIIQQPGRVRNSPLRTRPGMFKMKKVKNLYFPPRTAGWPDTIFSVLPGRFFSPCTARLPRDFPLVGKPGGIQAGKQNGALSALPAEL